MLILNVTTQAQQAQSPHQRVSENCQGCHVTAGWTTISFDHSTTEYPLENQHSNVACVDCHNLRDFAIVETRCSYCHTDVHQSNLGADCQRCHSTHSWSTFDFYKVHEQTDLPAMGAHVQLDCESCHTTQTINEYSHVQFICSNCHINDYNASTNPAHVQAQFSTDCRECHSVFSWAHTSFDHSITGFVLDGAHERLDCVECHSNNNFSGMSVECFACHEADYSSTSDPNHTAGNFPTNCVFCHSTTRWKPAQYNHDLTNFPLTGAHRRVDCVDCHVNDVYSGTPIECFACHEQDFNGTSDPDHVTSGFSTNCEICHTTNGWVPSTFDHAKTAFPLTGAHKSLQCIDCHANGYAGTATDCAACHIQDFDNTTDPDHRASGFDTNCEICHSTSAWTPATFDHNDTGFPLTGAHQSLQCLDCHANGYTGTAKECAACHQQDSDNTTDPDHAAANFPLTCQDCHSTAAWKPATFNHDSQYFPIYSGKHRGEWDDCSDCHVNAANYAQFECINCHEHSKSRMDDKHSGVSGYVYNSQNCYNCHPDGRE